MKQIQIEICESTIRAGTYKVWVRGLPTGPGWLRGGFAWKTQTGAIKAAKRAYPTCTILWRNRV
jgi:hypothetical protein